MLAPKMMIACVSSILHADPAHHRLDRGPICRAFADMVQTYNPGRIDKHVTDARFGIAEMITIKTNALQA